MSDATSDEVDHSDGGSSPVANVGTYILGGMGAYLGIFVILFLDEVVLRTHWVSHWIPESFHVPMRVFFYPLLLICHWLGWLPDVPPLH